jgi:MOSC domain-containing protein YiiM
MIRSEGAEGQVLAVCISAGGVPKIPQPSIEVGRNGVMGDHQAHEKHIKPTRALSLIDEEILQELRAEGFNLAPGTIGENITLRNVRVQQMAPGAMLQVGGVKVRLEEPRRPCFVLDVIDERLKDVVVGRCGYMASVVEGGRVAPGDPVVKLDP